MATGVNVKMGVTGVSEFKRGMKDAEGAVKSLDAQLKLNEAQLKLNGNQELYMKNKVELLKAQIDKQAEAVRKANEALQSMKNNGVDKTSASFQTMQTKVFTATAKLTEMKAELKNVETGSGTANTALESIGKNVSWDNVAEGLGKITDQLKSAGQAALRLGKRILDSAKGSTGWADELVTLSQQTGIDTTRLQQMQQVAEFVEADVDAIITAQQKMAKATTTQKGVKSIEEVLGIELKGQTADELFWEIGDALANMGEGFDKEAAAQQIFGRSWHELLPLFKMGREQYETLLESQTVLSEEQVQKLAEADDAIVKVEQTWQQMKNQFWADNADKITEMMTWLIDNKELVVGALTAIGGAFGAMKLAEFAANLMKVKEGLGALGLFGGAKAAAGGSAAAAAAGSAAGGAGIAAKLAGAMTSTGGLTASAVLLGLPMIDKFFNGDARTADQIEKETMQILGGQEVVDIYDKIQKQGLTKHKTDNPDWRPSYMQDQSYYNGPGRGSETLQTGAHGRGVTDFDSYTASIDRMTAATENASASEIRANSEVTAAIGNLNGLPAAMAAAVAAGMRNVTIVISEGTVNAIGRKVGRNLGNKVQAFAK